MNGDAGEALLVSLFANTEPDDDSKFNPDDSVVSAKTGKDSLFDELLIASGDVHGVYGQCTRRPEDKIGEDKEARP